ncbi:hypothetical protein VB780_08035 [Leptolyngbya sp. CCNP1308]|uniref:hypothetical protein n=1 Tax=Leptolyngbya sp. CCNP1308 TaxID=3110255 RepID=UPI002B1FABC2|nr:hypothetical protein [Leptolyngbya sp. CCNP1308]MEA5448511.1 hypothetical protein [Leptolyngbya sp. CCNP1308]
MPRRAHLPQPHLPPDLLAAATAQASSQGRTLDDWLTDAIRVQLGQPTAADVAQLIAVAPLV